MFLQWNSARSPPTCQKPEKEIIRAGSPWNRFDAVWIILILQKQNTANNKIYLLLDFWRRNHLEIKKYGMITKISFMHKLYSLILKYCVVTSNDKFQVNSHREFLNRSNMLSFGTDKSNSKHTEYSSKEIKTTERKHFLNVWKI